VRNIQPAGRGCVGLVDDFAREDAESLHHRGAKWRGEDGVLRVVDAARPALIEQSSNVRIMPDLSPRSVEELAVFVPGEETRKSLRAMRMAYADVVLENKAWGLPVIQWREGRGLSRCRRSSSSRSRGASSK
jgi:hypothetical protein